MASNTHRDTFPILHFVCNYIHNLKTEGRIKTFYLSNDCSTIRDIYSLGYSCMHNTMGELWIQTHITTTFWYILCALTCTLIHVTQTIQVICRHSTYWTTAVLSKVSFLWKSWMQDMNSKLRPQTCIKVFYSKPFVVIRLYLRHLTGKLQFIFGCSAYRTKVVLLDTFFVWFRVAWKVRLESYCPRHASVVLCYNIVCIYFNPIHTSLFRTQLCLATNSHTLWLHTTHQTTALLQTKHRFITTKLATYTTSCHFFQLIVYTNVKITMRYYHTSLWVCCQAERKEHKVKVENFL